MSSTPQVSFWTPVKVCPLLDQNRIPHENWDYEHRNRKNLCNPRLFDFVEEYFNLSGQVAVVIPNDYILKTSQPIKYGIFYTTKKIPTWNKMVKIISYITSPILAASYILFPTLTKRCPLPIFCISISIIFFPVYMLLRKILSRRNISFYKVNYDINPESYDLIHPEMKKYFDAWISKYIFNLDTPVSGFIEKLKSCWMITPTFHTQSPGTGYPADHVKVASRKVEKIGPEMDRNSLIFTKGMDLLQPIFVIKVKVSCTDVASGGTDHWIVFRQENDADGPNPSIWKEGYSKSFRVLLTKEFTPYTQAPPGLDTFASLLKGDEVKRCENYVFTFGVEQAKKELEPIYNEIKKTPLIENIS